MLTEALDRWPPQQGAAGEMFKELWVPASELGQFNAFISGRIDVIHEHRGIADVDLEQPRPMTPPWVGTSSTRHPRPTLPPSA